MSTAEDVLAAMRTLVKVTEKPPGEYTSNSPLRPGSDSGAFSLKIDDGEHGVYHDHVSDESGSLYDLAEKLGVKTPTGGKSKPVDKTGMDKAPPPLPKEPPKPKTPSADIESLEHYAKMQGAPVVAFHKAKVRVENYQRIGDAKATPHLVFPCSGDRIDRMRRMVAGLEPKYFPRKTGKEKVKPQLYGFATAEKVMQEEGSPLVLANGQTSVIVAQHYGIAAFCITDGENKDIPDHALLKIIKHLDEGITLIIAKDGDGAGRTGMKRSYKQFAMRQYKPTVIDFGGDDGFDLANHCAKHGDTSLPELLSLEVPPPTLDINAEAAADLAKGVKALTWEVKQNGDGAADAMQKNIAAVRNSLTVLENMNPSIAAAKNPTVDAYNMFQQRVLNPKAITGLSSGHKMLDIYIAGFNTHAAHILVGATGSGKSQLGATWARKLMEQAPGAPVSYEAGTNEFVQRLNSVRSGIPFTDIAKAGSTIETGEGNFDFRPLTEEQIDKVRHQFRELQELDRRGRYFFPDKNSPYPSTVDGLFAYAKKMKNDHGIEWILIDSLNNLTVPGAGEQEAMAKAAVNCERMAVELGLIVIATAQPGRSTKERSSKVLTLHDAKWSSEVEDKAYVHMSIYNHWLHVDRNDIKEKPSDHLTYPKGTSRLYLNKSRGSGFAGRRMTLKYRGGVGFYNYSTKPREIDIG